MVAVSSQKITCDQTHTALDVWKVGAALELFGTSWAGRGWRNEGRAKWCGLGVWRISTRFWNQKAQLAQCSNHIYSNSVSKRGYAVLDFGRYRRTQS